MSANRKPRKAYRTKPLLTPVLFRYGSEEDRALKLIPHTELEKFRTGVGTESGWHDLAVRLNFGYVMATTIEFGMDLSTQLKHALDSLVAIQERFTRTNKWGGSGDELTAIGQALNYTDDMQQCTTRREQRDSMRIVMKSAILT